MATITGLTAARMLAIEASCIVDGEVVGDNLILTKFDDSTIDAGSVRGPQGPAGLGPGMIPGEIRMWSGSVLPDPDDYSTWVWANGGAYLIADHPIAADYIHDNWRTFGGAADPGVTFFRVPDLRGLVPAGMDTMPAGSAANRVVRADADILAEITGEETHVLTDDEMPVHSHVGQTSFNPETYPNGNIQSQLSGATWSVGSQNTSDAGGDDPHENMQPTVFIPYIVCLDGTL